MGTLLLLTGLALGGFGIGMLALIWSIRGGQFDDLDTPAVRMLGDDPRLNPPSPNLVTTTSSISGNTAP